MLLQVPEIDSQLGITTYTTDFEGCGGVIKKENSDFQVTEVLSEKGLSGVSPDGSYPVYVLEKNGIDTNHALGEIRKKTGVTLVALGLKDASAATKQYVYHKAKSTKFIKVDDGRFSLEPLGLSKKPLSKTHMIGNRFRITVRDGKPFDSFSDDAHFLNYYGYQRFGSKRPVTHLVGRSLIQRDYEGAIRNLLSYTSKFDSAENTALRERLSDWDRLKAVYDEIPKHMDLERSAASEIISSGDAVKAVRALPLQMRRFFVQAYQSYIFNCSISAAFDAGEDLFAPQSGDVCYDGKSVLGKYENDPQQTVAVPFVGYSYYKKTRFHYFIDKVLQAEEITAKDFYIKEMQEISSEGGFRNAAIKYDNFMIHDDMASFTLSRGSYATMVMREIMKPTDPLSSGF